MYSYSADAQKVNALTGPAADVFTVQVSDGLLSTQATLTVNITGANDRPTITAESAGTVADTRRRIRSRLRSRGSSTAPMLICRARTLSYKIVGQAPDGNGDTVYAGLYGTLTVHGNGSYSYLPNAAAVNALSGNGG